MAISKETSMHYVKISILIIASFMLTVGITPYIFSYFDSDTVAEIDVQNNIETEQQVADIDKQQAIVIEPLVNQIPSVSQSEKTDKEIMNNSQESVITTPLPELDTSDDFLLNELNSKSTASLFIPVDMLRNMVVFIDNFSRGELISHFSPLHKPIEPFTVSKHNGAMIVDSASYLRYNKYANVLKSLDTEKFIEIYTFLTPLIDEAYQEIGYPAGSFNDTFITAIDHVLETPIIHYNLKVSLPSVMYQYVDENIESLPDTQKLLLRMGPNNLQIVKQKLQNIQSELQRL